MNFKYNLISSVFLKLRRTQQDCFLLSFSYTKNETNKECSGFVPGM